MPRRNSRAGGRARRRNHAPAAARDRRPVPPGPDDPVRPLLPGVDTAGWVESITDDERRRLILPPYHRGRAAADAKGDE